MKRFLMVGLLAGLAACSGPDDDGDMVGGDDAVVVDNDRSWDQEQGPADTVATVQGLDGPEAVRYDADEDVWYIANFGEESDDVRDGNGFIARVNAGDGTLHSLRWAVGSEAYPLHQPRGMYVTGDTLWVADVDGVHGFDKRTGQQMIFRDLTEFEPGFLNDIAEGPDGALYVTDTGRSAVYRMQGETITEAMADSALFSPNGITFDRASNRLVLVPWGPGGTVRYWTPGAEGLGQAFGVETPGRLDGVEIFGDRMLVASQSDSTISVYAQDGVTRLIKVPGAPADIGIDTRRNRVAVPYIALDRVDIWQLPGN